MPCNSDYLKASPSEVESRRAAELLTYAVRAQNSEPDEWIVKAATEYYGAEHRLTELVQLLCETCSGMSAADKNRIIYNARDKSARALADWWEEHQEADRQRLDKEASERKREDLKAQALAKLSDEEKDALDL